MSKEKELILEAKHVTKKFPLTKGKELIANDDVSLKFYKGQTLGIVGESGCGKSTFVRMVTFLEKPTSGEILYHGKNITGLSKKETWENRQNLQMVFQDPMASFSFFLISPKFMRGSQIISPTFIFGLKEVDGFWKTICTFLLFFRSSSPFIFVISFPLKRISPEVGCSSCTIIRINVDFPQPLSPTIPSVCPL